MAKETILVVEDNPDLREAIRDILSDDGYTVITANNGQEALVKMGVVTPDLVISDIGMPHMDGFTFFEAVRARPEWTLMPFIFLTARSEKAAGPRGKGLGAEDYLIKPLTRDELLTAVSARLSRAQQLRMAQLQQAYENSLTMLANAIEAREGARHGHVERLVTLSLMLAAELGLQGSGVDHLRLGAILHDIGKIVVHGEVLRKTQPLSPAEWAQIQSHAFIGAEMIRDIPYLFPVIPIVRHHHERWDGKGYPSGLAGEQIPLPARIIALADGFDVMTIEKPYRRACSLEEACEEIVRGSGSRYDPRLVAAFQRLWQAGKVQAIYASR